MLKPNYLETFDVPLYDSIIQRGLSNGVGQRDGQMCIEAAICTVLGLPHGDEPECVAESVRVYKISLNDSNWSSPQARAAGLRDLGIAQLGSKGVVNDVEFASRLRLKTINVLIPAIFREVFTGDSAEDNACLVAATNCENARYAAADAAAAAAARYAADAAAAAAARYAAAADARYAARYAAAAAARYAAAAARYAARYAAAAAARYAARYAADADASSKDKYLIMSAGLALEVLRELNSPGCDLLENSSTGESNA